MVGELCKLGQKFNFLRVEKLILNGLNSVCVNCRRRVTLFKRSQVVFAIYCNPHRIKLPCQNDSKCVGHSNDSVVHWGNAWIKCLRPSFAE